MEKQIETRPNDELVRLEVVRRERHSDSALP